VNEKCLALRLENNSSWHDWSGFEQTETRQRKSNITSPSNWDNRLSLSFAPRLHLAEPVMLSSSLTRACMYETFV